MFDSGQDALDGLADLGIGLAIVRRLALLLGGRTGVHSVPGRGSAFSGAAPEAKLISIRVFACDAADWEYIIRALDYVATNLVGDAGRGLPQVLGVLEVGRINIASG